MTPTELTLNHIATIFESVADSDGVVASSSVILGTFVLGRIITALGVILFVLVCHCTKPDRFNLDYPLVQRSEEEHVYQSVQELIVGF